MKKLLIRILIFLLLFAAIDRAVGEGLTALIAHAKGGDTGRNNEIADHVTADIIVFGSSRAIHHYDPRILGKDLGMTCYNAGRDGNGILMMYPYYKMLSARYSPKLIIYDLSGFDVDQDDHSKYLVWLRQFYGRPAVDSMVWDINPAERYKMLCQAYRYNGKSLQIVSDAIHPLQQDILGYKPLTGSLNYAPPATDSAVGQKPIDPFKEKYLVRLIQDCKRSGTKLVFYVSPTYGHRHRSTHYAAIQRLCRSHGIPLFYHQNDRRFISDRRYFQDSVHLNAFGAEKYSEVVAREISQAMRPTSP